MNADERFRQLVDEHYEEVWRYASFCARGADEVDDVVQEAFLAALERLRQGEEFAGNPRHWLQAVARNITRSRWRKLHRLLPSAPEGLQLLAEEVDRPLQSLVRDEAREALRNCVSELSEPERALVEERYAAGREVEEMARAREENPRTLRVKLYRIRQRLKACLEARLPGWREP